MATRQELLDTWGGQVSEMGIAERLARRLNPAGVGKVENRAWQWKLDLWRKDENDRWVVGPKNKFDLYDELAKAPGEAYYKPGPKQMEAHRAPSSIKQVSGGWRAGKSKWLAAEMLPYMFRDKAVLWNVADDYLKARWEFIYIVEWLKWLDAPITQLNMPNNGKWTVALEWGAMLQTQTAGDVTTLEGAALDCAGVGEAGLVSEAVIRRLIGRVMQKRGPILMAGSLDETEPWYMLRFQDFITGPTQDLDWHSFSIPSWDNLIAFPDGEEDSEIKKAKALMTEDEFKLKICAEVAKPSELVFPEFDRLTHVCEFIYTEIDKEGFTLEYPEAVVDDIGRLRTWKLPKRGDVMLAIDPGFNGAYAVLAIRKYDDQIFIIDEVYARRWLVQDVIRECKTREWWSRVSYAVMDIAGKQNDAMGTHLEIWALPEHLGFRPGTNYVPVPDGIHKLKTFLKDPLNGRPKVWVAKQVEGLISEFGLYRYRLPKDDRPVKEEPIDNHNHSIKALEYFLVDRFGYTNREKRVKSESYIKEAGTEGWFRRIEIGDGRWWQ